MIQLIVQALVSGVLVGGVYALIALGIALTFGTMRIINLAHGELVLLAAYMAFVVEGRFGVNPYAAIPLALLVTGALATAVYFLLDRIREHRELNSMIFTFAVGVIVTNAIVLIWSSDVRSTNSAALQDSVSFGGVYAMVGEVAAFALSVALAGVLWLWLKRSWYGRAVRAVSSNRAAAKLMGVNPTRTELVAFLVSAALASFAGAALYSMSVVYPPLGQALTLKGFVITVLAGVGSIPGVLLAAILLGVTEALTVTFASSALQELAGMVLFLVVLFVLPNGLFGAVRRRG